MAKAEPKTAFDGALIPESMREATRWVNWQAVQRDGRWTKVPINSRTMQPASSTDPGTWSDYEQACRRTDFKNGIYGVGFMLGDGWVGVDFDGLDFNVELMKWVGEWIEGCGTYVELSPSGTGYHAIYHGVALPSWSQNRRGPVEVYEKARFFCVTGNAPYEREANDAQYSLDAVCSTFLRRDTIPAVSPPVPPSASVGNHTTDAGGTGDASAADWALCCDLAARGFREQEIVCRLREKMEREGRHEKARRDDYVVGTARKALSSAKPAGEAVAPLSIASVASVMIANPVKTPYVISRVLRRGEVGMVVAPPKARKSFLVADLAIAGATGGDWFGQYPVAKGRVLLVDNELSLNEIADRTRTLLGETGHGMDEIRALDVMSLRDSDAGIDAVVKQIEELEEPYDLIVFDALYMFLEKGMDENSNADMTVLLRKFRRLAARTGAAVMLVHHTSKGIQSGKDSIDLGAGAGALGRAVDANIAIYKHAEEDHFVMKFNVRSSAPIGALGIRWRYPSFSAVMHGLDLEDLSEGARGTKKKKSE
jgi:hypothetical protein